MQEPTSMPVFGGNPGSFRRSKPATISSVLVAVARSFCRGAFREGTNSFIAGAANLFNQWFCRRSAPRFRCSCCGRTARAFVHLSNRLRIAWNSSCPGCDSRSRHRGLALLIPRILGASGARQRVLHFAPEVVLRDVLDALPDLEYRTTDFLVQDVDFPGENIESLSFPSASFDALLCNHVLEHVPNDEAAMGELSRILKPTGVAVITIPGDWSRKATTTFPTTDLNGHYRDYGLDVKDRFQRHFTNVEMFDLHQLDQEPGGLSFAIRPNDMAFICREHRPSALQPGSAGDPAPRTKARSPG